MIKKTLAKKFDEFVERNELKSLRDTDGIHYYLPYSPKEKKNRIMIFAHIFEESRIIKIGFRAPLKEENDIDDIRMILLDLNSRLKMGALSLEKDSNEIIFSIDYTVEDDENIDVERYHRIILYNISMYFDLLKRQLIQMQAENLSNEWKNN